MNVCFVVTTRYGWRMLFCFYACNAEGSDHSKGELLRAGTAQRSIDHRV
jgi:hypothetical protein